MVETRQRNYGSFIPETCRRNPRTAAGNANAGVTQSFPGAATTGRTVHARARAQARATAARDTGSVVSGVAGSTVSRASRTARRRIVRVRRARRAETQGQNAQATALASQPMQQNVQETPDTQMTEDQNALVQASVVGTAFSQPEQVAPVLSNVQVAVQATYTGPFAQVGPLATQTPAPAPVLGQTQHIVGPTAETPIPGPLAEFPAPAPPVFSPMIRLWGQTLRLRASSTPGNPATPGIITVRTGNDSGTSSGSTPLNAQALAQLPGRGPGSPERVINSWADNQLDEVGSTIGRANFDHNHPEYNPMSRVTEWNEEVDEMMMSEALVRHQAYVGSNFIGAAGQGSALGSKVQENPENASTSNPNAGN